MRVFLTVIVGQTRVGREQAIFVHWTVFWVLHFRILKKIAKDILKKAYFYILSRFLLKIGYALKIFK